MNNRIISLAIFFFSANAFADSGYVCIADMVSGFYHDPDRNLWANTTFLSGERFEISEIRQDTYKVERIDERSPWSAICTQRTDQTEYSFSCENRTNEFHFNRKELRFTAFRYFGYWNGSGDSLSIAIGNCFPS